jgi:hypothetical protein
MKSSISEKTTPENIGKNDHNMHLCSMCSLDTQEPPCSYEHCDEFEYRPTVNYLCEACVNECKQYAHVDILRCVKYKKCVSTKE